MVSKTSSGNKLIKTVKQRLGNYISESDEAKRSIMAVYLFGSALHPEKFKADSDIDLAFHLDRALYKKDPLTGSAPAYMAAAEIGMEMDRQTDVIILNSASIETAYQAVTTGILVYEAISECRLEYEALIRGLYFDFKPFLEKIRAKSMLRPEHREPVK